MGSNCLIFDNIQKVRMLDKGLEIRRIAGLKHLINLPVDIDVLADEVYEVKEGKVSRKEAPGRRDADEG